MTYRPLTIPGAVAQAKHLSSDAKVVYAYLAPMEKCSVGPRLIGERLGMSASAARRACIQLEERGLIRRKPIPGYPHLMTVLPLPELVA